MRCKIRYSNPNDSLGPWVELRNSDSTSVKIYAIAKDRGTERDPDCRVVTQCPDGAGGSRHGARNIDTFLDLAQTLVTFNLYPDLEDFATVMAHLIGVDTTKLG